MSPGRPPRCVIPCQSTRTRLHLSTSSCIHFTHSEHAAPLPQKEFTNVNRASPSVLNYILPTPYHLRVTGRGRARRRPLHRAQRLTCGSARRVIPDNVRAPRVPVLPRPIPGRTRGCEDPLPPVARCSPCCIPATRSRQPGKRGKNISTRSFNLMNRHEGAPKGMASPTPYLRASTPSTSGPLGGSHTQCRLVARLHCTYELIRRVNFVPTKSPDVKSTCHAATAYRRTRTEHSKTQQTSLVLRSPDRGHQKGVMP